MNPDLMILRAQQQDRLLDARSAQALRDTTPVVQHGTLTARITRLGRQPRG